AAVPASAVRDRRVALAYSRQLVELSAQLPKVRGRSVLVHSLIHAYKLLDRLTVLSDLKPLPSLLHSEASALKSTPVLKADRARLGSVRIRLRLRLSASSRRVRHRFVSCRGNCGCGRGPVSWTVRRGINWTGGCHHAKRDEASGFCYINDIVYGVLELKKRYDRVMYIDLDLHHGDGVEEAFYYSAGSDVSDAQFAASFAAVIDAAFEASIPARGVCQCGADALATDEFKIFNLTLTGYLDCVKLLLQSRRPLLLLGGGGYHFPSTAKLWTAITALAVGVDLDKDIPEHSFFSQYGPDFCLDVTPSLKHEI
uniref:histone deacetylase n=1 Tax=Macrostomum lignano TaxID=282301 RepID=A0A1I8FBH4_9PLAT